ncbi:MAG: glycoside hydrolase family 1 protein [Candidatus Sungbacteria bacterium]|nr:glycoside hydrolase family 1 protein [Candidatus Sungbacteria bacterium]
MRNFLLVSFSPLREENYISGKACDHYNRFREDFDIARSLGHNAHRFSIEWSRIEPEEGKFDEREIGHYRDVVRALRGRGIEPFVTLWHWTLPRWLRDQGGVLSPKFSLYFGRYVEKVVRAFNQDVTFWIVLNEPLVYTKISYLEGRWPPQKKSFFSFFRVSKNLIKAHKTAYGVIKNINSKSQIGIAHNMSFFEVERDNFVNRILKLLGEWRKNFAFLNAIRHHQDFIGFNYYSHYRVNFRFSKVVTEKTSDMGWSLYPPGIYSMLCALKKYNVPIFITENGLADARDKERSWFISEHLKWVVKAIQDGVNVRGYFHWSLLDNFEWSDGFWPRFGLVEVDYKTMKRKIRSSALVYKQIIESARLPSDLSAKAIATAEAKEGEYKKIIDSSIPTQSQS